MSFSLVPSLEEADKIAVALPPLDTLLLKYDSPAAREASGPH